MQVSEMCCTRLTENTGRKNLSSAYHRTTLSGYIFALRHIDNQKKLVKQRFSSTCSHSMVIFGPLMAETGWWVRGTTANFTSWLCYCTDITQPNFARCLAVSWAGTLLGALAPNGILQGAKFTFKNSQSCLLYWQRYTLHGTQTVGISQALRHGKRKWNYWYGTFAPCLYIFFTL